MFTIEDIIRTLNQIEVHGKNNMDRLLGAIMALEAMLEGLNNEAKIKADEEQKARLEAEGLIPSEE